MTFAKIIPTLLSVIIVVFFLSFIIHFSTGIPQADDFPMMFQFLDNWEIAETVRQKYQLLTEQFLDHRMLAMKLTVLLVKAVFGKMSINAVNTVGILIWLATISLLFRAFTVSGNSLLNFIPVLFLTLHPGFGFDGLFWAATWMAFPWAIFFSIGCFYFLAFNDGRKFYIFALCLSVLAMFSHGNGILCCMVGLLILILQKKYRPALTWFCLSAAGLFLFFYQYKSGGTSEESPIRNLFERPFYVFSSIGAFTGGSVYFPNVEVNVLSPDYFPAIIFGLVLSVFILTVTLSICLEWAGFPSDFGPRLLRTKLALFLCATGLFIVSTAIMMSCVRTNTNVIHGFAARYHFYSALLISVFYMFIVLILSNAKFKTRFAIFGIVAGFVYWAGQYWYQTAEIADYVRIFESGLYNSKTSGSWVLYKDARFWERGLDQYSNEKIWTGRSDNYRFPAVGLNPDSSVSFIGLSELPEGHCILISDHKDNFTIRVKGSTFQIPAISRITDGVYVNLVSRQKSFLYPLRHERMGLRQFVKNRIYYKSDIRIDLKKKWFAPGIYCLSILIIKGGRKWMIYTEKMVKIDQYPYEI